MKKRGMRQLNRKLRSQSGASLMVALLFFLVCAIVGVIVLTAATASMGRVSAMGKDQKNKYAVQSAANVIVNELQDNQMSFKATAALPEEKTTEENATAVTLSENKLEFKDVKYGFGKYGSTIDPAEDLSNLLQNTNGNITFMGSTGDLQTLERNLGGLIFLKDMNVKEGGRPITGTWDETTDGQYNWNWQLSDSDGDIFRYTTEDPATITASYGRKDQKVMAVFSIDANFNISVVLYPAASIKSKTEDLASLDPQEAVKKADHVLFIKIPAQVKVKYKIQNGDHTATANADVVWGIDVTDDKRSNVTITSNKTALDNTNFFFSN